MNLKLRDLSILLLLFFQQILRDEDLLSLAYEHLDLVIREVQCFTVGDWTEHQGIL